MKIQSELGNTVIMITHDVDEAVLLSDRIVMMTNGPAATVGQIVDVNLPRPRERLSLAEDARFNHCRKLVLDFLYSAHAQNKDVATVVDDENTAVEAANGPSSPVTNPPEGSKAA